MANVITFHHAAIATQDIECSVAFYRNVVGLEAGHTPDAPNPLQWMYAGDTPVIHIFQPKVEREEVDGTIYGVAHLALHIDDFEAAKARLDDQEIEYSANIFESRNSRQLFFDGPDGERIELIEFGYFDD